MWLCLHPFCVDTTDHSKPSSTSGDQVIANSVAEHDPNQSALKST